MKLDDFNFFSEEDQRKLSDKTEEYKNDLQINTRITVYTNLTRLNGKNEKLKDYNPNKLNPILKSFMAK